MPEKEPEAPRPARLDMPPRRTILPDTPVLVPIDGVSKRFGERPVLHDVSLRIRQGEVVSIIGLSDSARPPWLAPSTRCRIPTRGRRMRQESAKYRARLVVWNLK
ncbi:hypothetical protein [Burkholderia gladioli]|uniref:hypothetical protein n=1 Tax=Burkholderia gladioli TaxID=28095 RepID=UPI001C274EB8|nr:hypothetical protein [Burkholderia gladioli]MBU9385630.1 hypothetical protein [Burkholderia gladioli]